MAEKMTRRELRSPDKFTQTASGWLAKVRQHPREALIAAGGALVALLLIGVLLDRGDIKVDPVAGGALSEALELASRPVGEAGAEGEESFATEEERRAALAEAFESVRQQHGSAPAGLTATLALADLRFAEGAFDEALSLYDAYLAKTRAAHLRVLALEGKALALEGKGEIEAALAAFDAVVEAGGEAKGLYGKARLLERQEKWDEARAAWETLKDEHGLSSEGREANQRLARLDLAHPDADEG